eukprot:2863803-Lingulodinium_polyedra.AAC.1
MKRDNYTFRCATPDDIPRIIPEDEGPHYFWCVITCPKYGSWPWCRLCHKHDDSSGSHRKSNAHLGCMEYARSAVAALQAGRSKDPPPPAAELEPFNGRN